MKTKFIGIDTKEDRTVMRKRAREALIHWKVNHVPAQSKLSEHNVPYDRSCRYEFDGNAILWKFENEYQFVFIPARYQTVMFDVSKEQWVIDLFNQLLNVKATAN